MAIVFCITTMAEDMVVRNISILRVARPKEFIFFPLLKVYPLAFGVMKSFIEFRNLLVMVNRHVFMRSWTTRDVRNLMERDATCLPRTKGFFNIPKTSFRRHKPLKKLLPS